jgi:hypothetical protein
MTYPIEVKAAALAMMLTGETLHAVERRTGVPRRTLRRWWDIDAVPLLPTGPPVYGAFDFSLLDQDGGRQRTKAR